MSNNNRIMQEEITPNVAVKLHTDVHSGSSCVSTFDIENQIDRAILEKHGVSFGGTDYEIVKIGEGISQYVSK